MDIKCHSLLVSDDINKALSSSYSSFGLGQKSWAFHSLPVLSMYPWAYLFQALTMKSLWTTKKGSACTSFSNTSSLLQKPLTKTSWGSTRFLARVSLLILSSLMSRENGFREVVTSCWYRQQAEYWKQRRAILVDSLKSNFMWSLVLIGAKTLSWIAVWHVQVCTSG